MREFRFLVPPTMVCLTWILESYFYGKPVIPDIFNLGEFKWASLLTALISLPAIGFLISQVSIFAINVCDVVFVPLIRYFIKSFKMGTFYFMDVGRKVDIVEEIYPFLRKRKKSEINTRLWFAENMKLGQDELPKWLERRWSMAMTNLNTFVALIFTWVLFSNFYNINIFTVFFSCWLLLMIAIILLFNLGKAWIDIRLVESYFFEKLLSENKKDS